MTDPRPIPRPTIEARRRQILGAASECARRSGFHGARMAEIAQGAGLSVGQIYRYFESKDAIIGAIIAEDMADTQRAINELQASGKPFIDALAEKAPKILDEAFDQDRAALMLEVAAESARNPAAAALLREADADERAAVLEVIRPLVPGASERELAARVEMLSVLFDGLATRAVAHPEADREALCEVFRSLLRRLLAEPLKGP